MKTPIFKGVGTALVTPFTNDFVDFAKLGELIDEQIAAGVNALIICGTTGEASTQSIPEHLAAVEYAVKYAAGRVPIVAGTGSNDTAHALMMSQNAEKSGADALLLVTPYYNKCSQIGLVKHFEYIADRVRIPIILYNVPSRTGMSFSIEAYETLAKHPRINGTKEASSNKTLIDQVFERTDLNVWSGNDNELPEFLGKGGAGVISVASNVIPREMADICRLYYAGDVDASMKIFKKYEELMNALFIDVNPIPVKTAMNLLGKSVGHLRMPLCDMPDEKLAKLTEVLCAAGLLA